jgi:hypothetical protein
MVKDSSWREPTQREVAKHEKSQKKDTKCPEKEEKEDTTFPASPDPTANMHCDERQEKKGW